MFKIRNIQINSAHDFFALILEEDAEKLGLNPMDRIKIFSKNSNKFVICELEIIDFKKKKGSHKHLNLKIGELGLLENAFIKLNIIENSKIDIIPAKPPESIKHVRKKFLGEKLSQKEYLEILIDIVENRFTKIETTYFVLACTIHKLSIDEIVALTNSMVNVGKQLEFKKNKSEMIVDKHCIGGVPGNRTTMIIIPIIASLGLKIPKTSSRAITSPAGTADTMEILANVEIKLSKMYDLVEKENGCLIWGGGLDLSPADDLIIQIEHPLNLDSEGQMIASILSKKKSAGSEFVLIDIPVGKTAKITNITNAKRLKKVFEKVGNKIGIKTKVIITNATQPIGNGIGALYEAKDIMNILENKENIAEDLKEKSLYMAGIIIDEAKKLKKGSGYILAKQILENGTALEKFKKIIQIQGENTKKLKAKFSIDILANKNSRIKEIDNKLISKLAFVLGAPKDKTAGMILYKKIDELIEKDKKILTLYSDSKLRLKYGVNFFENNKIFILK